jgi:hypothetical protein
MTPEQILQLFEQAEPAPTISEYEREQRTIRANYERLKAERLAREAKREIVGNVLPGF